MSELCVCIEPVMCASIEITFYEQQHDHSVVCLSVLVMCTSWQPASKADYVGAVCQYRACYVCL